MKIDVAIPQVGESITEVTIGQWVKKDGDLVEMDEVLCEIESEKATLEIRSESSGKLKILAKEGETLAVGAKIAEIDTDVKVPEKEKETTEKPAEKPEKPAEPVQKKAEAKPKTEEKEEEKEEEKAARVSPVAAKLLQEAGISLDSVSGTGQQGRITKADAEKVIGRASAKAEEPVPEKKAEPTLPKTPVVFKTPAPGARTENREKMSTLRRTIARRLVEAKNETAMLTTFNEIDMSAIVEVRNRIRLHVIFY
jgi:2-oxoglutarate dehydrogenase E2 component (dihydrolipoamide succinyltransferase)